MKAAAIVPDKLRFVRFIQTIGFCIVTNIRPVLRYAFSCLALITVWQHAVASETPKSLESIEQKVSGAILRTELEGIFGELAAVEVMYTPVQRMGTLGFGRRMIEDFWIYRFSIRCQAQNSCGKRVRAIRSYIESATELQNDCPRPYAILISFSYHDGHQQLLYVNPSGRCFATELASYWADVPIEEWIMGVVASFSSEVGEPR